MKLVGEQAGGGVPHDLASQRGIGDVGDGEDVGTHRGPQRGEVKDERKQRPSLEMVRHDALGLRGGDRVDLAPGAADGERVGWVGAAFEAKSSKSQAFGRRRARSPRPSRSTSEVATTRSASAARRASSPASASGRFVEKPAWRSNQS